MAQNTWLLPEAGTLEERLKAIDEEFPPLAQKKEANPNQDARAAYQAGDYAEALRILRPAAEQGDAEAQNAIGSMYSNGDGVPQDYAEAVRWVHLSAEQGYASAQRGLGYAYKNGFGVPQDFVQAHMWLNLAGSQGSPMAQSWRDDVASRMTPDQIAEAQQLAREWIAAHP